MKPCKGSTQFLMKTTWQAPKLLWLLLLLTLCISVKCIQAGATITTMSKNKHMQTETYVPHVHKEYEMLVEELVPSADDDHAPLLVSLKETVELHLPHIDHTESMPYHEESEENENLSTIMSNNNLHYDDGDDDDELFTYPAGVELVWLYLAKRHELNELEWSGCGGKWRPEWSLPVSYSRMFDIFATSQKISNKTISILTGQNSNKQPENNRTMLRTRNVTVDADNTLEDEQEQRKQQYLEQELIGNDNVSHNSNTLEKLRELRHYLSHHVVCSHSAVSMCARKREYLQNEDQYNKQSRYKNIMRHWSRLVEYLSSLSFINANKWFKFSKNDSINRESSERLPHRNEHEAAREFQWVAQFISSLTSSPLSWTKDTPRHIRPSGLLFPSYEKQLEEEHYHHHHYRYSPSLREWDSDSFKYWHGKNSKNYLEDKFNYDKTEEREHSNSNSHAYKTEIKHGSNTSQPSWCSYHLVSHDTLCTQHISHWLNAGRSSHAIEEIIPNEFFNAFIGSFYIYLDSPFHHFSFKLTRAIKQSNTTSHTNVSLLSNRSVRVIKTETRMSFVTDDATHLRTLQMLWNSESTIHFLRDKKFELYAHIGYNRMHLIKELLKLEQNVAKEHISYTLPKHDANALLHNTTTSHNVLLKEENAKHEWATYLASPQLFSRLRTRGHDRGVYELYLQPAVNNLLDMTNVDVTTLKQLYDTAHDTVHNGLRERSMITTMLMFPLHLVRPTLYSMHSLRNTSTIDYAHVDEDTNTLSVLISTNLTRDHIATYTSHYTSLLKRMIHKRCAINANHNECALNMHTAKVENELLRDGNSSNNTNDSRNKEDGYNDNENNNSDENNSRSFGVLLVRFAVTHGWTGLKEMPRDANSYRILPQPAALLTRTVTCHDRNVVRWSEHNNTEANHIREHFNFSTEDRKYEEQCCECNASDCISNVMPIDHATSMMSLMHNLQSYSPNSLTKYKGKTNASCNVDFYKVNSNNNKRTCHKDINNTSQNQFSTSEIRLLENSRENEQVCLCHTWLRAREVSGSTIPTPDPAMVFNVVALWSTILTATAAVFIRITYKFVEAY